MKATILSALLLAGMAKGQQATITAPTQFCLLFFFNGSVAADRQKIQMDYGQKSKLSPVNDAELRQESVAVEALDSGVQALAYMDQHGWQLVSHVNIVGNDKFYFKRLKP